MAISQPYCFITDIGSTTTKGILIDTINYKLLGIAHADTTVEEPINDVAIGVFKAAKALEGQTKINILGANASPEALNFASDIAYLSTSSAGGGLQILVIGLTLFDSASSAKRAAYGAGGVILDVFAIDDKRKTVEQMQAMRNLRPDLILVCGGTDGGALGSVLRMAEILRIAKPLPKYSTNAKIPTIYAGNHEAADMIKHMISRDFDLHILPNLRPSLEEENLKPTQDKIQELFMSNVMERAPGYHKIKQAVKAAILPTPSGVLKAMQSLGEEEKNLMAFDIGGATTDVFSRINGHFQRTVSANLGMSYSALNVLKEIGVEAIIKLLPPSITATDIRNYIGNKSLFPTVDPIGHDEYRIEHAIAKTAISMAYIQHQDMHYNSKKLGYLDTLKQEGRDKYEQKFHYVENEQDYSFYPSDIHILIGAGGVFAHAQNTGQCLDLLISGFEPQGITELVIDKHFISPHLGVLSQSDARLSQKLLDSDGLQALALYIRPHFSAKAGIKVLSLKLGEQAAIEISSDDFVYYEAQKGRTVTLQPLKRTILNGSREKLELSSDLPIIIDTRLDSKRYSSKVESTLGLYTDNTAKAVFSNVSQPQRSQYKRLIDLPYKGEIFVATGAQVKPDDVVGTNQFDPARLFVIQSIQDGYRVGEALIRSSLQVKVGDIINYDQVLALPIPEAKIAQSFRSQVRAKVEYIEYAVGMIVASEIQDYDTKPRTINLADKLQVKPKQVSRYLQRMVGSFVYEEETLARKVNSAGMKVAKSPGTGEVVDFDRNSGVMTIQYRGKAFAYKALVHGAVTHVEEGKSAELEFDATRLGASIGWGPKVYGQLRWLQELNSLSFAADDIAVLSFQPNLQDLQKLLKAKPRAIICASLDEELLLEYLGYEQGVINTGFENPGTSLLLMQGFGYLPYSNVQQDFLLQSQGKACYIDPHTRIRAGVVRAGVYVLEV